MFHLNQVLTAGLVRVSALSLKKNTDFFFKWCFLASLFGIFSHDGGHAFKESEASNCNNSDVSF